MGAVIYTAQVSDEKQQTASPITWEEVAKKDPILLNLGGCGDCHPRKGYEGFVAVDIRAPREGWWVYHDLLKPIPLPDGYVERIHTEEFLQFLPLEDVEKIIRECYRVLKSGGRFRISTVDFNHPKNYSYLLKGKSPYNGVLVLMHYELLKEVLDRSPFEEVNFLHYWKDGEFVQNPIDYSLGHIRRTPEHDKRNREVSPMGIWKNFLFRLSKGFRLKPKDMVCLRGKPNHITSLVVDCVKH